MSVMVCSAIYSKRVGKHLLMHRCDTSEETILVCSFLQWTNMDQKTAAKSSNPSWIWNYILKSKQDQRLHHRLYLNKIFKHSWIFLLWSFRRKQQPYRQHGQPCPCWRAPGYGARLPKPHLEGPAGRPNRPRWAAHQHLNQSAADRRGQFVLVRGGTSGGGPEQPGARRTVWLQRDAGVYSGSQTQRQRRQSLPEQNRTERWEALQPLQQNQVI